jgi:hypothetical protein
MTKRRMLLTLTLALLALPSFGRVLSYAPVTDRMPLPAVQSRLNRHFALMEGSVGWSSWGTQVSDGQLVVYDAVGGDEPRVVLPAGGKATFLGAAAWESPDSSSLRLLALTDAAIGNAPATPGSFRYLYSSDGGRNWMAVSPAASFSYTYSEVIPDVGGPVVRARGARIAIGTAQTPFVFEIPLESDKRSLFAVDANGASRLLIDHAAVATIVGTDRDGSHVLVRTPTADQIAIVGVDGSKVPGATTSSSNSVDGWIAADGLVYLNNGFRLTTFRNGQPVADIADAPPGVQLSAGLPYVPLLNSGFFAVPTADYRGAWVMQRGPARPTVLSLYTPAAGLVTQWSDISGPEVEALHTGASGQRLLIQVHRPRPVVADQIRVDPALAVWEIGTPAPKGYDELFLNEVEGKGFVHVDADTIGSGAPFVFDSAIRVFFPGPITSPAPPSAGGGADVTQEWGVVRGSLQQRLVLPAIARLPGAYGSFWQTDLVFRNPSSESIKVVVNYVPTAGTITIQVYDPKTLTLAAGETRVVRDALKTLFDLDSGGGAMFVTPEVGQALNVTSRTYNRNADGGTYGMGINAIDVFAAASPRFPSTFAGGLHGANFRTNFIATDVSGRSSSIMLTAAGNAGIIGRDFAILAPANGQAQANSISDSMGVTPNDVGAILFRPATGAAIGSLIAIDNRTNDPTYFPPDLPATVVRTIPAIGHLDGANGSKFRSDLFLYNPSSKLRNVTLTMSKWDNPFVTANVTLALLPNESKIVRDALFTIFNQSGIARLRFQSNADDGIGVRVTSRTYTIDENGGTYGFLMPPLNAFQTAASGESLEILGAVGDPQFRTNLSLVDVVTTNVAGVTRTVRIDILDEKSVTVDSFQTTWPAGGGIQLLDLFRARGLGDGPKGALIRVTPFNGSIGAFATMIDNKTNDPTYLGPYLSAAAQ